MAAKQSCKHRGRFMMGQMTGTSAAVEIDGKGILILFPYLNALAVTRSKDKGWRHKLPTLCELDHVCTCTVLESTGEFFHGCSYAAN